LFFNLMQGNYNPLQYCTKLYKKYIIIIVTSNSLKTLTKRSPICNIWFSLYTKYFI